MQPLTDTNPCFFLSHQNFRRSFFLGLMRLTRAAQLPWASSHMLHFSGKAPKKTLTRTISSLIVSGIEGKTRYKCTPDQVEQTLALKRGETLWQLPPVTDTETPEPAGHGAWRCPMGDTGERQHGDSGGHLLRDAKRGRHRKSSGHRFQSACQPRWGAAAGFTLSFTGMQFPRGQALAGSSWGTRVTSKPNDRHNIKHAKSIARFAHLLFSCPHTRRDMRGPGSWAWTCPLPNKGGQPR